jgi:hypothetical protein
VIKPYSLADDLGGKAMTVIRIGWRLHAINLVDRRPDRRTQLPWQCHPNIIGARVDTAITAVLPTHHPANVGDWGDLALLHPLAQAGVQVDI